MNSPKMTRYIESERLNLTESHYICFTNQYISGKYGGMVSLSPYERLLHSLRPRRPWYWMRVQRLPALLNEVHRFIESKGLRFVMLGSS